MASSIRDYVSEGADVSYERLVKRFGEPEAIAFAYVNEMETDELVKELSKNKRIVIVAATTAIIFVLLWVGYLGYCYSGYEKNINGYMTVEIIEVERKLIDEGGN